MLRCASGERVSVAGLVLVRQRPGTASGVIFATLEDETGIANIIVWPKIFERFRAIVLGARLLRVWGRLQSEQGVIHVVAERLEDLTPAPLASLDRLDRLARHGPDRRGEAARSTSSATSRRRVRALPACSPRSRSSRDELRAMRETQRGHAEGPEFS